MKKIQFFTFTLLLAFTLFLPIRVATAQLITTLEGHTDLVWSVAFSPNGQTLASGSQDRTIRLWNSNNGKLKRTLTGHRDAVNSVAFSPDGRTLASGSWDGTIRLWNPNNGKLKRTLTGHTDGISFVAFSPDGQTLASASGDGTIRLWNPNTGQHIRTLTGHTNIVDSVAFSPDGRTLASGSRDQTIRLWNPNNGKLKRTLTGHTGDISRMTFSPDGRTLASGSRDETVRLWNPNTGQHKRTLTNRTGWTKPIVFSSDGATLLIGGHGISIWDAQTGQYKKPFARDITDFFSVVFSPDVQMVASGSADNKVRLWEFNASDYEIPSITTNGMVRLVYLLPNDRSVRPERVTALRQLIKDTQQFFADEMQSHGFGRKTFSVETNKDREPVVHHIDGKFPEEHYYREGTGHKVWTEVRDYFDDRDLQHIHFVAIDLSTESIHGGKSGGEGSISFYAQDGRGVQGREADITQREEAYGGFVVISASGDVSEKLSLTAHELGHAFGLLHDFREARNSDYVMAYGSQSRLSKCSAEWLSVHHFFNTTPISRNTPADIQLLSTRAYSRETISLRFKVTDVDGLHHAQLLLPEYEPEGGVSLPRTLFDCQHLNGKTSTFESAVRTAELIDRGTLQIIDVNGNITWATLPIQLDAAVPAQNVLDINNDGIVNTSDLTPVALRLGRRGKNPADINEDGVVNTVDLLLVAANLSSVSRQTAETFAAADVQKWLTDAKQLEVEDTILRKGIVFLEHLLTEITLLSKPMKVAAGPSKAIFEGHTDFVSSVAFSPDGQTLASASWDGTIRLWDTHTAQLKTLLIGHTEGVNNIAFSPDGQTLASVSWDTTIRLWDPHNGQHKTTLRAHSGFSYIGFYSVAFSPDGQTLATGGDYSDSAIRLWNLHNEQNIRTLTGHTERIMSVAFSPDGQTLASGSADKTIRLWNPHNGQLKKTLTGHTREVESVAFSPDGQTLATGGRDRTIRLWNPRNGQLKRTLTGYTDWINPLAFSPDGEMLASGSQDQRIRLWNTQTSEYKNTLQEGAGHIISIVFSPNGQMLASGREDGTVRLWDIQSLLDKRSNDVSGNGAVEVPDHPPMYWVNTDTGTLHRLVGTEVESLVSGVRNATNLAIDIANEKLYWTEKTSNTTGRIRRANLDGTSVQLVKDLTSVPHDIALDAAGGKIYVTNAWGKIQRLNVDGSNFQPNLITDLESPKGLALDVSGGKVYWTEMSGRIRRANLDGSNVEGVVATDSGTPMNLVVFDGTVYWTQKTGENLGEIRFVAMDGNSGVVIRNTFTQGFPVGLAVDSVENKLYWTTSNGEIGRSTLGGGDFQPNFVTGLDAPGAFVLNVETPVDVETPVVATTDAVLSISPSPVISPAVGERLTLNLKITAGEAVAGYQFIVQFDPTALRYVESGNGDYLPTGAFFVQPVVNRDRVELASSALAGVSNGGGTLATVTFEVMAVKPSTLTLSEPLFSDDQGNTSLPRVEGGEITEPPELKGDVNADGVVNIQDLVLVASSFGKTGQNSADINADGVVNIADLVLVAGALGATAAAPSIHAESLGLLTAADVREWLSQAHRLNSSHVDYQRGLLVLEQLLTALAPKESILLPNYPNPFNPETWIPYQLATSGDVKITIYDARGIVVRRLELGYRQAGYYTNRSRAAYWDGCNGLGEPVASGLYFYHLEADGVSLLRKMVTLK